jgi:hypothetical protein
MSIVICKCLKQLQKISPIEVHNFKVTYYEQIVKIKYGLKSLSSLSEIQSLHDKIFKILNINKYTPLNITRHLGEFIKGITYFSYQQPIDDAPIYHRLSSCGNGSIAFREKYNQCTAALTFKEKRNIKKQIETCYIERLIYNELYKDQILERLKQYREFNKERIKTRNKQYYE